MLTKIIADHYKAKILSSENLKHLPKNNNNRKAGLR